MRSGIQNVMRWPGVKSARREIGCERIGGGDELAPT